MLWAGGAAIVSSLRQRRAVWAQLCRGERVFVDRSVPIAAPATDGLSKPRTRLRLVHPRSGPGALAGDGVFAWVSETANDGQLLLVAPIPLCKRT
jgi:hypothetical protein